MESYWYKRHFFVGISSAAAAASLSDIAVAAAAAAAAANRGGGGTGGIHPGTGGGRYPPPGMVTKAICLFLENTGVWCFLNHNRPFLALAEDRLKSLKEK